MVTAESVDIVIEMIRCMDGRQSFEVLPRRWAVERTFGWTMRRRRLTRD